MTVFLWALLIFAVLLMVALFSPVCVGISYDERGFTAILRVLFLRIDFPRPKRAKRKSKETEKEPEQAKRQGGSFEDLIRMLRLVIRTVGKLLRSIRIRDLKVDATIASEDPFQTAMMFGGSGAGIGILLPLLEKHFRLKKKRICVNANFEETETKVVLLADCSIVLVQLLAIALVFAYNFWKEQKMKSSVQRKDGNNGRAKSE